MDSIDAALALKSLQTENTALKILLRELDETSRYKRETELVESVKGRIFTWIKWVATVFAIAATAFGFTTFLGAKQAAVDTFLESTEPSIKKHFYDVMMPQLKSELEIDAAHRIDDFTSASSEQFQKQIDTLFGELTKFPLKNKLGPLKVPQMDGTSRPMSGVVLRSFLTPSTNNTFIVNTFRLNVRDEPNGKILGRQVQGARVEVTEKFGEWVRIEVLPTP